MPRSKRTTATTAPQERLVWVEWLRDAPLPVKSPIGYLSPGGPYDHACNVGGKQYGGSLGERQQVPLEVWRVLSSAGFVKQVFPETEEV